MHQSLIFLEIEISIEKIIFFSAKLPTFYFEFAH